MTEPKTPAATVKIVCISDKRPWTDTKPLDLDEEAEVPADVAAVLVKRGFAKKV